MEPPPPRGIFSNLFRKTTPPAAPPVPPSSHAAAAALHTPAPGAATSMEQDRREQRLAKNRESARQSRRRKKEKLELLSERMCELNEELEDLREEVGKSIGSLDDPAREERQALRVYRFARLRRLLSSPHARFWMWQHRQDSTAYSPSSSSSSSSSSTTSASKVGERLMQQQQEQGGPQGWDAEDGHKLWPLLCFELQLKGEQEERARALLGQASRREMEEEVEALAAVVEAADALEKDLETTPQKMHAKMAAVRRVLTPAQVKVLERFTAAATSAAAGGDNGE